MSETVTNHIQPPAPASALSPFDLMDLADLRREKEQRHDARHATHEAAIDALIARCDACEAALAECRARCDALEAAAAPEPEGKRKLKRSKPSALVDEEGKPWLHPETGEPLIDDQVEIDAKGEIVLNADGSPKLKAPKAPPAAPPAPPARRGLFGGAIRSGEVDQSVRRKHVV
jgi:hypothetical protein